MAFRTCENCGHVRAAKNGPATCACGSSTWSDLPPPGFVRRFTPEEIDRVIQLRLSGVKIRHIAVMMGRPRSSVWMLLNREDTTERILQAQGL